MPTTYAHWRFGQKCLETLPDNLKNICEKYRSLFDLAVHGPDIFFYDLSDPAMNTFGSNYHHNPGVFAFKEFKEAYQKHPDDERTIVYILGFLTHYAFDSMAHGYIERTREVWPVSHNKIESEYDRHLIESDGYKYFDRAKSLKPSKECAKVISYFFNYSEEQIYKTIKMQRVFIKIMNCHTNLKRNLVKSILHKKHLDVHIDLLMDGKEYTPCSPCNLRLDKYQAKALENYPKLVSNLLDYLQDKADLDSYFEKTFNHGQEYLDIPILQLEEELTYKL